MKSQRLNLLLCFCFAESFWSSLTPSILLKHIMVFKNALAFMLKNHLLGPHNPDVKNLLEVLKLLYKVSSVYVCCEALLFYARTPASFKKLEWFCHATLVCTVFLQANKVGKSYKVPLSSFYVEEIVHAVNPDLDLSYWWMCFNDEVEEPATVK